MASAKRAKVGVVASALSGFEAINWPYQVRLPKEALPADAPKKEAWSFVCRSRALEIPQAPCTAHNVAQIFHRHWQEIRQSTRPETEKSPKRRLEKGVVGKVGNSSFRMKATSTTSQKPKPSRSEADLVIDAAVAASESQESSQDAASPSTPNPRSPTNSRTLSRQATDEKLVHPPRGEGPAGLEKISTERLPRVRTFQYAADKEDEDPEDTITLSREAAAFRDLKAQVAASRLGSENTEAPSVNMPFSEDRALEVFTKLAEYEEMHESELNRAVRMLGYMHPNDDWIREIFRDIAPTYNTMQFNEYFTFVKNYATRHHEACSDAFSKYEVLGRMDGPSLQEAVRDFGIHLLPYVVQEILEEVNEC